MKIIDCHSHLSFLKNDKAKSLLEKSAPGYKWVMGGYDPFEWERQLILKKKYPDKIFTCFGLHPWYAKSEQFDFSQAVMGLKNKLDHADFIGEVGLDFFGEKTLLKKELQIELFEEQLSFNRNKPYVFHIVKAHGKALEILKNHSVKGFVHNFSGSIEVAEQYCEQGLLLSFGPSILNKNSKKARAALCDLPLENILIESDAPSGPEDHQDPLEILKKVYKVASELKGIDILELEEKVADNIKKIL